LEFGLVLLITEGYRESAGMRMSECDGANSIRAVNNPGQAAGFRG
jgi:hypothetical protein